MLILLEKVPRAPRGASQAVSERSARPATCARATAGLFPCRPLGAFLFTSRTKRKPARRPARALLDRLRARDDD
jgi:hypothetical protein